VKAIEKLQKDIESTTLEIKHSEIKNEAVSKEV
jgi:hypothetical protein